MKMNFYQVFITGCDEAVSFKMFCDIVGYFILIQVAVASFDQELCIITISELIVFCINSLYSHFIVLRYKICGSVGHCFLCQSMQEKLPVAGSLYQLFLWGTNDS